MSKIYSLGCRKDPSDPRDIPMALILPPVPVPKEADYSPLMSPVRNQGDEGTCVAFASVVGVKEYQDKKEYEKLIGLSPRFLYEFCKKFDGIPEEEGTYPRVAMKMLLKYGVCLEDLWPYVPNRDGRPKKGASENAGRYRIKAYARLKGVPEMKRSLVVNGPFLAGVEVFDSWFTKTVEKTGLVPMPKSGEASIGGHAICVAGYDDVKKVFKFKNSWGAGWGAGGYGYIRYEYIARYCSDAWSATDLIEDPDTLARLSIKL